MLRCVVGLSPSQVLKRLLQERYDDYVAKTGGRGGPIEAAAREAVQAAFRHAAALNAHALVAGRRQPICSCGSRPNTANVGVADCAAGMHLVVVVAVRGRRYVARSTACAILTDAPSLRKSWT